MGSKPKREMHGSKKCVHHLYASRYNFHKKIFLFWLNQIERNKNTSYVTASSKQKRAISNIDLVKFIHNNKWHLHFSMDESCDDSYKS